MELSIGRVVKTHGVRGEVVVEPTTDDPGLRFAPGTTLRGRKQRAREYTEYEVVAVREHSGRLLLSLRGIEDRTVADTLRGTVFLIDVSEAVPSDDPDEFYDHELEGLAVRTVAGEPVGILREVLHTVAGELLSVRHESGREILVPFVKAIVPVVAIADGYIEVDPPQGLLDLDQIS